MVSEMCRPSVRDASIIVGSLICPIIVGLDQDKGKVQTETETCRKYDHFMKYCSTSREE